MFYLKKKTVIFALLTVLVVAALLYCFFMNPETGELFTASNPYIATVDGVGVTKAEYLVMFKTQKDKLLSENKITTNLQPDFWKSKIGGKSAEEVLKQNTLEKIKELKIQLIKVKENKLVLDKNDLQNVDKYVEGTSNNMTSSKDRTDIDKQFKKVYGITKEQYGDVYKEIVLINKLVELESKKMQISEDDIKNYYDQNRDSIDIYTTTEILISTINPQTYDPLPQDQLDKANRKAYDILNRINNGEDMKSLGQQYSDDPAKTENNCQYTFSASEGDRSAIENWAIKAKPGDTGIVQDPFGYVIIRLDKRTAFDDERIDTRGIIFENRYMELLELWKKDTKYNVIITNQKEFNSIDLNTVS